LREDESNNPVRLCFQHDSPAADGTSVRPVKEVSLMTLSRLSPAKINFVLNVLRKREDGYHDIASLMQAVGLYDEMEFAPAAEGITIRCPGSNLPEDEGNIVYRAARALFSRMDYREGIHITIRKAIPMAAGLGGGSSNAATTLLALNDLLDCGLGTEDLINIAKTLGADVPFFIFGAAAWAFGIGERLEKAEGIPRAWLLLINPGFELSTKTVYEKLNLRLTNAPNHYSIPRFCTVHDLAAGLHNDLEKVSLQLHPSLRNIKELLIQNGALGALMSGSGPTVFGIFEDELSAQDAEKNIRIAGDWSIFRVTTL
jgi:4-diphosphocytidyl-2-C-methyl-D-erythritol kinase